MQKTKLPSINIIWLFLIVLISFQLKAQGPYDVSSKKNEPKQDTTAFMKNFQTILPQDWKDGMRFIVEPSDFDSKLELYKYGKSENGSYNDRISQKDFEWKIFKFLRFEYRDASVSGEIIKRVIFIFENDGEEYEWNPHVSQEKLKEIENILILRGLVYLGDIDKAKELLVGKRFYTLYKNGEDEKFIQVKITDVGLGDSSMPIRIIYELPNGKKSEILASFGKTNSRGSFTWLDTFIKINNLEEFFTEVNPKLKYPNISESVWALIMKEEVKVGMSEEECILSWGKPSEINKTSYGTDQWVYGNSYLYFEKRKLVAFN
jgi:hypothetical protein